MKITVRCNACEARFQTAAENAGRQGRCPQCKTALRVPPPAPPAADQELDEAPATAQERLKKGREKPPLPTLAVVSGAASIGWGALAPIWCLVGLGLVAEGWRTVPVVGVGHVLALEGILGLILAAGGLGQLLRKNWGWWAALSGCVLGLIDLGRIVKSIVGIVDWDHPEASGVAGTLFVAQGIPALIFVALIVLLCLPVMRRYYGVSVEQRERPRRKAAVPGRSGRRSR